MSGGPCDRCLAASATLAALGGHLHVAPPSARPRRALALEPEALIEAIGGERRAPLKRDLQRFDPTAIRDRVSANGLEAACRHGGDFGWPRFLDEDPEPPWVLFTSGDASLLDGHGVRVAVVGARKADRYGRDTARRIGSEAAAAGATVVSGLALGIDASAHLGALDVADGATVAVVGGGIDRPYPRSNAQLHRRISEAGCVVSEMPPGTGVWRWSFPARNRLIAAMSRLVVVVQADLGSGSLHTAEAALMRGVEVAGVPGRIDTRLSSGVNRLIADGAVVVSDPGVVPGILGLGRGRRATVPEDLVAAYGSVLAGDSASLLDRGGDQSARLALDLARLELGGYVERAPGGRWVVTGRAP